MVIDSDRVWNSEGSTDVCGGALPISLREKERVMIEQCFGRAPSGSRWYNLWLKVIEEACLCMTFSGWCQTYPHRHQEGIKAVCRDVLGRRTGYLFMNGSHK